MNETASTVTLQEIVRLCREYAEARDALEDAAEAIRDEQRAAVRRRLRGLKARIAEAAAARGALRQAVAAAPALFERPRSRAIEGIKVGYRKMPGRIECADEAKVIARIRRHWPGRETELVRVKESLDRGALKRLDARDLAAIGVRVVEVDDEIVIAAAANDLDKLVDALLEDGQAAA